MIIAALIECFLALGTAPVLEQLVKYGVSKKDVYPLYDSDCYEGGEVPIPIVIVAFLFLMELLLVMITIIICILLITTLCLRLHRRRSPG